MNRPSSVALRSVAAAFIQFVVANIVTLVLSFGINMKPEAAPVRFVAVVFLTFTLGVTLGGLLALGLGLLPGGWHVAARGLIAATFILIVLVVALALGQVREASPLLTGAIVAGIVGFHVPGWHMHKAPRAV